MYFYILILFIYKEIKKKITYLSDNWSISAIFINLKYYFYELKFFSFLINKSMIQHILWSWYNLAANYAVDPGAHCKVHLGQKRRRIMAFFKKKNLVN